MAAVSRSALGDDLRGYGEAAVEVLDGRFSGGSLADAQTRAVGCGQDDGADLMGLEGVAHGGPGGVDCLVEEGFLDGDQQMIGKHAKERVSPILHLRLTPVESWNSKSSTRFILIGAADWR